MIRISPLDTVYARFLHTHGFLDGLSEASNDRFLLGDVTRVNSTERPEACCVYSVLWVLTGHQADSNDLRFPYKSCLVNCQLRGLATQRYMLWKPECARLCLEVSPCDLSRGIQHVENVFARDMPVHDHPDSCGQELRCPHIVFSQFPEKRLGVSAETRYV